MICNDDQQNIPQAGVIAHSHQRPTAMIVGGDGMMGMEQAAPGASGLDRYLHALRRNWFWCLLLGTAFAVGAGITVFFLVPDRYTAFAELRAYSRPQQLINDGKPQQSEKFETFISNVKQLIQARRTLASALRKDEVKELEIVRQEPDQERWLADELKVSNPKDSEVLIVSLTAPNPKDASILVNAVVQSYMEEVVERDKGKMDEKLKSLRSILAGLTDSERKKRSSLETMAEQLGTIERDALSLQTQMKMEQAQQLKREFLKTSVEYKRAAADLKVLEERAKNLDSLAIPADELEVELAMDPEGRLITEELNALFACRRISGGNVQ